MTKWSDKRRSGLWPGVQLYCSLSYFCPCVCRTEEEIEKHDRRVAAHWCQLKKALSLEGGPREIQTSNFQHIIDSGKLPLMINAGGSSALPMPRHAEKKRLGEGQRTVGVFEAIVAGSESVKAQEEKMVKKQTEHSLANEYLLKTIADSKRTHVKYVPGFIQGGVKKYQK